MDFDIETNIAPLMRQAITLVDQTTGVVIYVAQAAFGRDVASTDLEKIARLITGILELRQ